MLTLHATCTSPHNAPYLPPPPPHAFRVTWSFISDTSPKCIDRKGLGRRRTGTKQDFGYKRKSYNDKSNTEIFWKSRYLSFILDKRSGVGVRIKPSVYNFYTSHRSDRIKIDCKTPRCQDTFDPSSLTWDSWDRG